MSPDPAPVVLVDVTRLLARAHHATPRGIDRVVLEYVRHFSTRADWPCRYCAWWDGAWWEVPRSLVQRIADLLERRWSGRPQGVAGRALSWLATRRRLWIRGTRLASRRLRPAALPPGAVVYLNVSHKALDGLGALRATLAPRSTRVVVMVHDLLPLEEPQWYPPSLRSSFARGIDAVAREADLVITNSHATQRALGRWWPEHATPRVLTAHLGTRVLTPRDDPAPAHPYFVFLGSVEPRKNVELLLDLWEGGAHPATRRPELVLLGSRAPEAATRRRLERMRARVRHVSGLDDAEVARVLRGARALLLPSHAEGFGLPVVEALALGVPVLCSEVPALEEVADGVAERLDAGDRDGWAAAIERYTADGPERRGQLERMRALTLPTWAQHFRAVRAAVQTMRDEAVPSRAPAPAVDPAAAPPPGLRAGPASA